MRLDYISFLCWIIQTLTHNKPIQFGITLQKSIKKPGFLRALIVIAMLSCSLLANPSGWARLYRSPCGRRKRSKIRQDDGREG